MLHGGNVLDTGLGDPSYQVADIHTFSSVLEKVHARPFLALGCILRQVKSLSRHLLGGFLPCPQVVHSYILAWLGR